MNCEHCDNTRIEPFETSGYPPEPCSVCRTVEGRKKAKNYIASHTWARLTWEQRVTLHNSVAVHANQIKTDDVITYHLANTSSKKYRAPIVCETLSQMQFVSQNEYKIGEAITILSKL